MRKAYSTLIDRQASGNSIAVFSRNLKALLFSRGPKGSEGLRIKLGVDERTIKLWLSGGCLPSPAVIRQIRAWAGLPSNFNLTRQLLVELEMKNVTQVRARWIEKIRRMPAQEIQELQPGIEKILFPEP